MKLLGFFATVQVFISSAVSSDLKGFDDTVLFKINWPGKDGFDLLDAPESESESESSMTVMSNNKERYKCIIPTPQGTSKDTEDTYEGPSALDILQPLFAQSTCTYRLESYWTYEVCHGRYVRQYHEDREGATVTGRGRGPATGAENAQEYYLGRWDKAAHDALGVELERERGSPAPTKRLDSVSLPYLQLNMTDGTLCDLNGRPRRATVLYVCYRAGKHEIYSFKETSTCEYELVVLSSLLCQHPKYKPQDTGEQSISCLPLDESPKKPRSLRRVEAESKQMRMQREDERLKKVFAVFSIDKVEKDGENRVRLELRAMSEEDPASPPSPSPPVTPPPSLVADTSPVDSFLAGTNCLQGGSGWWRFEFCYGRHVTQFHVEPDGSRTTVLLGRWQREAHTAWLAANPHKRPHSAHVTHLYTDGDTCDRTGLPRRTEVKLKCVEEGEAGSGAVSLYLLEPHACQYVLGVESPLVCRLLPTLDHDGLTAGDTDRDVTVTADDTDVRDEL